MTTTLSQLQHTYLELRRHGMPEPDHFRLVDGVWVDVYSGLKLEEPIARDLLDSHVQRWWLFEDELRTITISEPNQIVAAWDSGADYCNCTTVAGAVLQALQKLG